MCRRLHHAPGVARGLDADLVIHYCQTRHRQQFGCLALTIEMPFKDNAQLPNLETGWSGERSRKLGARSLSDLGIVGCKSAAAVHFSPSFCPIAWLWVCKSGKNRPRWGRFSLSTPQARQAPSVAAFAGDGVEIQMLHIQ
jgi:hypothetical protein